MRPLTFRDTAEEVLVRQPRGALPQRNHARLDAYRLEMRAVELVRAPRQLLVVHVGANGHLPAVDLEDARTGGLVRERELDLAVQTAGTEKGGVQDVDAVRRGDDLEEYRL